jgi:hypothetical protein
MVQVCMGGRPLEDNWEIIQYLSSGPINQAG